MATLVDTVLLARKVPQGQLERQVLMESRETRVLLDCLGQVDHQEEEDQGCVSGDVGGNESEVRVRVGEGRDEHVG